MLSNAVMAAAVIRVIPSPHLLSVRHGTVDDLRFAGDTFHKAIAIKHSPASVVCSKASRAPHSEFANSGVGSEKHVSVAMRDMLQS